MNCVLCCKKGIWAGALLLALVAAGCGDEGDITSPRLTIDEIVSPTNVNPLLLSGSTEEGATVQVSVTPAPATVGPVVIAGVAWTCALTFLDSPGASYFVSVTALDQRGNRSTILPINVVFDNQPPLVTDFGPADGTEVPLPSEIFVVFSEPMREDSMGSALTVTSSTGQVVGSVTYDQATRTAVFVPGEEMAEGMFYTVTLDDSLLKDLAGNVLDLEGKPATWTFQTAAAPQG
jgi:hypothetical protein